MSFDRIQRFRSQKLADESRSYQANPQAKGRDVHPLCKQKEVKSDSFEVKGHQRRNSLKDNTGSKNKAVTLRDFLHLTSHFPGKGTPEKKINRSSIQSRTTQHSRTSSQRMQRPHLSKEKEQSSKQEIFEIVKKDISKDLNHIKQVAQLLQGKVENKIDCLKLSNAQMIEIYNFRKRVRENVVKELNSLDQMIVSLLAPQGTGQEEGQMPVIFEEEQERRMEYSAPLTSHHLQGLAREDHTKNRMHSFDY